MNDAASSIVVAVVIPTHNRCQLLARLLASLSKQTFDPRLYEVIIVHNHTDDGTEAMARQWCSEQAFPARYYRKAYNGPSRSRDFGASVARGSYLAFIDDDCEATPDWLKAGLAAFTPADGTPSAQPFGLIQGCTLPMPGQSRPFLSKTVNIAAPTGFYETCNIFYRRSAFEQVGGFSADFLDLFYGEDTDLGWKVVQAGYESGFAPLACVHHEIFHVTLYQWLAEPLHFRNLPYLVRKYPGLRTHMYMRYFISRESLLYNLLPLALVLSIVLSPYALLVAAPYFVERYRTGGHVGKPHFRVLRACAGVVRGAFAWSALVRGSLRARAFLL